MREKVSEWLQFNAKWTFFQREQATFQWVDDDEVRSALDQHT